MGAKDNLLHIIALIVCLLVLSTKSVSSQSLSEVSKQIWIDANPAYFLDKDFKIFGDLGVRTELEDDAWWRLVIRPGVGGKLGGIFFYTAGLGNFITFNNLIDNRWEIRPYQGVRFTLYPLKIPMKNYIRLEERFDFNTDTWNSRNSLRIRYQFTFSYRWGAIQTDRYWQAFISGEAFFTLLGSQGQFQEQFRLTVGLDRSYAFDLHMRFELTAQQQQLFFDPTENVSDVYFRFRITRNWFRF
jgi:hypothetical protein